MTSKNFFLKFSTLGILLLFLTLSGILYETMGQEKIKQTSNSPISIELIQRGETNFASFLNKMHHGNRLGYRFFEHEPIIYGDVPLSDKEAENSDEKNYAVGKEVAKDPKVIVHIEKIKKNEHWSKQNWIYYLKPVKDGIELLLVVETFAEGLPEYYGVQQCFRLGGSNNIEWRRSIANTPAFSEYQLWNSLANKSEKKSLTWVIRNKEWQSIPTGEETVGARTPLGNAIDHFRFSGHLTEKVGPYQAKMLAPIDNGLIIRTDIEEKWLCGIYWENTSHVTNHHPADCLHSIINIGNIPPYSKRTFQGKIYWFEGTKEELMDHFRKDFILE